MSPCSLTGRAAMVTRANTRGSRLRSMARFIVRGVEDAQRLPVKVARLSAGMHKGVKLGGREYYVAVEEVGGNRVFLLLDKQRVESAEARVKADSVLLGAAAFALAAIMGWVLVRPRLRTPLAIIASASELMREDPTLPPRRYRGPHSRGLGLGLYLVSRICARLGWQIEAASEPGRGTTFRIRLGGNTLLPGVALANSGE